MIYLADWREAFEAPLYEYYAERRHATLEQRYHPLNTQRHREFLDWLALHTRGRRLLDVGCGEAHLVHTAVSQGWDGWGIDLAEHAIALGRSFGVPCDVKDFFSPDLDDRRFDVIVMSEFIEHVPRPARFLARAETLLEAGGLLYLTTPNFASLTHRVVGPAWRSITRKHLSYFVPSSLQRMIRERTGMSIAMLSSRNLEMAAIVAALRGRIRNLGRNGLPAATSALTAARGRDQELRSTIERSRALRLLKHGLNRAIGAGGVGDTIVALCRRA